MKDGDDITDPRELGGSVSGGTGDPHAQGDVIIDMRKAILQDHFEVVRVDEWSEREGETVIAALVSGRINLSPDRATALFVGNLDMAAAIITELHGVAERAGDGDKLVELCRARWARMPT